MWQAAWMCASLSVWFIDTLDNLRGGGHLQEQIFNMDEAGFFWKRMSEKKKKKKKKKKMALHIRIEFIAAEVGK